jgi:hypothetical protein
MLGQGCNAEVVMVVDGSMALQANWIRNWEDRWTKTEGRGMTCQVFARKLGDASSARYKDDTWGRESGDLRIPHLYVPTGFSGGGVYISVPSRALNPLAPNPNEGDTIVSNI